MVTLCSAAVAGMLIIVGGGLSPDNEAVHGAFIAGAKGGTIAIVPAASGEPARSAEAFTEALARRGVPRDRIEIVRLAVMDDASTAEDESKWRGNAEDAAEVAKIMRADAVWMTGGDQARLLQTLRGADGAETAMLKAMRARLAAGAVIGGTSAGAAVMSDPMIGGGESLTALLHPTAFERREDGVLQIGSGLGFLPAGIVDQHFEQRARLGRLARATLEARAPLRVGFGVDEDTAFVVDLGAGQASVLGAGSVTMIDAREASGGGARLRASGFKVSVLQAGDRLDLATLAVTPATQRAPIVAGKEYFDSAALDVGGMAAPAPTLADLLGRELLDNAAETRISRLSFQGDGKGVRYRFDETGAQGFFGGGRYTISGVRFAIEPIDVRVRERKT